jgi:signal transduction histidine kinase/integral membrane sensor domain MASE1
MKLPPFLQSRWFKCLLVAIAYGVSGGLTIHYLGLGAEASPLWIPTGIGLAAVLLWGYELGISIFLGDLLLMQFLGVSWGSSLTSAVSSTLSIWLGAAMLHHCQFSVKLARVRDVILFVLLGAMVAPTLNATVDTVAHLMAGGLGWQYFGQRWWILWLGDCSGVLVITPFLLRLRLDGQGIFCKPTKAQCLERFICISLLFAVGWVVFVSQGVTVNARHYHVTNAQYFEYLPFPIIVWAAIRFQTWGAVVSSLLISLLAIAGTLKDTGPFILQTPNFHQAILLLQSFIGIVTTTALLLSAVVAERQRAEEQLRATLERDRLIGETALRIHQSLDLGDICETAVGEVRQLLKTDRAYIGQLDPPQVLGIVAESVGVDYPSILQHQDPPQLLTDFHSLFTQHQTLIIDRIDPTEISDALRQYYHRYRVKAVLAVPLVAQNTLWGLVVVHQCAHPRHWQRGEIRLLEQLATQISIAIQQAQLYQTVQTLNNNLEQQVQQRTTQLAEKIAELEQFHAMKTLFWQAVAHDLRTSIMGLLMIFNNFQTRKGDNLAISRAILDRIIQSGDRQLTLINALSESHFAERHPLLLNRQSVSLDRWLEHLLQDWQPLFQQYQSHLILETSPNLPAIAADPYLLRQVFDHLLINALKHNPPGINLAIALTSDRGLLHCTLTDDGIGLTSQQCHQLFQLYVRSYHNPRQTGIGLGSYQCRQIIEAHGGQIGVNSQPDSGTQIWFTLPLVQSGCALPPAPPLSYKA